VDDRLQDDRFESVEEPREKALETEPEGIRLAQGDSSVPRTETRTPRAGQLKPLVKDRSPTFPRGRVGVFLLSREGHQKAMGNRREARELFRRSTIWIEALKATDRGLGGRATHELHEFSSFEELISSRPRRGRWSDVVIVTHGQAGIFSETDRPATGLFFGDRVLFPRATKPEDQFSGAEAEADAGTLAEFRKSFERDARLILIACVEGSQELELLEAMRDLLDIDGLAIMPLVAVNFDKHSGELGAEIEGSTKIRALKDREWGVLQPRVGAGIGGHWGFGLGLSIGRLAVQNPGGESRSKATMTRYTRTDLDR